jgi:hypothetical protein
MAFAVLMGVVSPALMAVAPAWGQEAPAPTSTTAVTTTTTVEPTTSTAPVTTSPPSSASPASLAAAGLGSVAAVGSEVATAAPVAAPAAPGQVGGSCTSYQYREDAQAAFDRDQTDPNGLDVDNDGLACEELPLRPTAGGATATTATPTTPTTRAPAAGTAPAMATTGRNTLGPTLFGAALILLGAPIARAGRRRRELEEFRILVFGPRT